MSKKKLDKVIKEFFGPKKTMLQEMVENELEEVMDEPIKLAQMRVVANSLEDVAFKADKAAKLQRSLIGDKGSENLEESTPVVEEQVPMVVDLGAAKNGQLNEGFLYMFGGWIESLLGKMFGMNNISATIKGTRTQIDSFAKTLQGEKRYIDAWRQYGLDDPRTHGSKATLDNAVKNFESKTGIKYPFK